MKKLYCVTCGKYGKFEKFENLKNIIHFQKNYFFLLFAASARMKMKKFLKKENQLRYLNFLV